jgi:hypothetical protein
MAAAAQYQPVGVLDPVIVGLILLLTIIDDNETPHTKTSRITSWEECFDRWNDAETSLHFRFSRAELRDLSNAIGFPETVVIGQTQNWKGRKIYATELFLITLKRFTYPDRWGTISMMFGLARPICSEIFSWTVDYLHRRFSPMNAEPACLGGGGAGMGGGRIPEVRGVRQRVRIRRRHSAANDAPRAQEPRP